MTRMIFSPKNTWEYFEKPPCPLEGGASGAMRVETKDAAQHGREHRTMSPTNAQHKQKEKGPQEIPYYSRLFQVQCAEDLCGNFV